MRLTYDATGRKWSKIGEFGTTSYASGIEYHDGKLEAIYASDGRMVAEYIGGQITRYRAEYFHQDHLGNTRLGFSDFNQNGRIDLEEEDPTTAINELEITQESHYYPFGMNQDGPWYGAVAPENKYLYNGKELNKDYEIIKAPEPAAPAAPKTSRLNTDNLYNLLYATALASYAAKGGIRYGARDCDSLKVTLVIENKKGRKSRLKLDLYEDKQVEKASRQAGEKLGLRPDLLELDIQALTDGLEAYREQLRQQEQPNDKNKVQLARPVQQQCLSFLRQQGLMEAIDKQLGACGLVGEHNNRRLGFCIISSYAMPEPLHGLIQGSSGSGKTHLLSSLCALAPAEHYIPITRATDNSFYNYQPYELSHKLISVEDKDAMSEEANLAFRELQTKGMVSSSTTGQDEQGNSRSFVKQVFGPIASLSCTTKGEFYLDDMNRCFLLAVDESEAQTRRILERQKLAAAGKVNRAGRQQNRP